MKGRIEKASDTIDIIKEHGFVFQKKYGQNFLIDSHVLDKIISASRSTFNTSSFNNTTFS